MNNRKQAITRRSFVENSSAAMAWTTLVGSLTSRAYAGENNTIKIALIGCGHRGTQGCIQALSVDGPIKLTAMADVFEDQLKKCLAAILKEKPDRVDVPSDRQFVGFDAYKQAIDSGVDGVLLTTTPGFRPAHFEYAVRQGKHVFMEKPVATDPAGVRRVLAANEIARSKGLKVAVGFQRRHDDRYQQTVQRIQAGLIGDVISMRCYYDTGYLWVRPRQPHQSELEYQMRNWYYFTWLSGDHIVEQHIHEIDACNWVMNGPPALASGHGGRQVRTDKQYGEIFDHHAVEFVYGGSFNEGVHLHSYCRQIPGCFETRSEYIYGTKGYATTSGAMIYDHKGALLWKHPGGKTSTGEPINPYQVEHDVLWRNVQENRPQNEVEYGAASTMTAILGRLATYSGKLVRYEQALESGKSLMPADVSWKTTAPALPNADGTYTVAVPGRFDPIG